jgi:hypothetical protein
MALLKIYQFVFRFKSDSTPLYMVQLPFEVIYDLNLVHNAVKSFIVPLKIKKISKLVTRNTMVKIVIVMSRG